MKRALFAILMITLGLLFAGCEGLDLSNVDLSNVSEEDINKFIVCDAPYIRHGTGCCLDKDENKICDVDEGIGGAGEEGIASHDGDHKKPPHKDHKDYHHDEYYTEDFEVEIVVFEEDDFAEVFVYFFDDEVELFFKYESADISEIKMFIAKELGMSYEEVARNSFIIYDDEFFGDHHDHDPHKHDKHHDEHKHEDFDLDVDVEYDDGYLYIVWDDYEGDDFEYYKVMHAVNYDDPKYPDDDAIAVIDDQHETEYKFEDYSKDEDNFFRISVVTESGIILHSDVADFYYPEGADLHIEIEVEIFSDHSEVEVEIDGIEEEFDLDTTDEDEIFEKIATEFDLDIEDVEEHANVDYFEDEEEEGEEEGDESEDDDDEDEEDEEEGTNETEA